MNISKIKSLQRMSKKSMRRFLLIGIGVSLLITCWVFSNYKNEPDRFKSEYYSGGGSRWSIALSYHQMNLATIYIMPKRDDFILPEVIGVELYYEDAEDDAYSNYAIHEQSNSSLSGEYTCEYNMEKDEIHKIHNEDYLYVNIIMKGYIETVKLLKTNGG